MLVGLLSAPITFLRHSSILPGQRRTGTGIFLCGIWHRSSAALSEPFLRLSRLQVLKGRILLYAGPRIARSVFALVFLSLPRDTLCPPGAADSTDKFLNALCGSLSRESSSCSWESPAISMPAWPVSHRPVRRHGKRSDSFLQRVQIQARPLFVVVLNVFLTILSPLLQASIYVFPRAVFGLDQMIPFSELILLAVCLELSRHSFCATAHRHPDPARKNIRWKKFFVLSGMAQIFRRPHFHREP